MATFYMTHSAELYHYGVLGMKWGVRRYQNPDGSLTAAGRQRYGEVGKRRLTRDEKKDLKDTKNLLSRTYEQAEYVDVNYYEAKRKADNARKKVEKAKSKGKQISQKDIRRHNEAVRREDFYKEGHKEFHKMAKEEYNKAIKKYGTKRIDKIPMHINKEGEYIYRKLMDTQEAKLTIGLAMILGGGAIGGAIAGGGTALLRTAAAKGYGRDLERRFYEREGFKITESGPPKKPKKGGR